MKVLAVLLFAVAGALAVFSYAALENLWGEYQDSADTTYIEVAGIELGLAALAVALGAWALRRSR